MGKIKKILENELVGGTKSTDIYPVTYTGAVYNENNEPLSDILIDEITGQSVDGGYKIILKNKNTDKSSYTIPEATTHNAGVMSAEDKRNLNAVPDNIETAVLKEKQRAETEEDKLQKRIEVAESLVPKTIIWNNNTSPSNMNDFIIAGEYFIKGEHTRMDDNLPILNIGGGHSFNARLTVLDSSIPGSGEDDDKCITQVLSFSNRLGQGEVYIRTGKGSSLNNLSWEKWSTLQRNVNVGEVGSLDDLKENGIYSGVWKQGRINPNYLAFVCIVINDYIIGIAPRRVSQFVYGLSKSDGSVVYQSRVWDDSKDKWGDWEILNKNEIASMISAEIKKVTDGIDPNKIDSLKDIITWIEEHGDVANILAAIGGLSDGLGQEIEARISADNDIRRKGVLFGGFSHRQTTANEVVIGYKDIDQKNEGAFSVPAATTEKAGVMTAADKQKLDNLSPGGGGGGDITATPTEKVIEEIEPTLVSTAIRKTPQVLTDSEKEIARGNIGAVGYSDLNNAIAEAITNTLNTAV